MFLCTAYDMHPYNCGGPNGSPEDGENYAKPCIHCNRQKTSTHNPDECSLCHFTDEAWLKAHGAI